MFQKILTSIGAFLLITVSLAYPTSVYAAEFRSGEVLNFKTEDVLNNAYAMASQITVDGSPVEHDLVLLADQATVKTDIKGGLMAATRQLDLQGSVGQSARLAAGQANIAATVGQDLMMWAGQATLSESSKVGGDVIFSGGKLVVNGQVSGKVVAWCECEVEINGQIGSFEGYQISRLSFGPKAVVEGTVVYQSQMEAIVDPGADIKGQVDWQTTYGDQPGQRQVLTSQLFYGTLASLIFCFTIAYFFRKVLDRSLGYVQNRLLISIVVGLVTIVTGPLLATIVLLPSVWLGISLWLLFILLMLSSFFIGQIILGWWLLQWWYGRAGQAYVFDWRAPLIGALIGSLCLIVPLIGPIILAVFFVIGLGGTTLSLLSLRK